jgi:hypothetical protein
VNYSSNEEEQLAFLEQLKMVHPKSAILSLIERHPHPYPSPEKVRIFHPHSPLSMNIGLDKAQLYNACQFALMP